MGNSQAVDVQIVNYRTKEYTRQCIESVIQDASASGIPINIHVVDNASGDSFDDLKTGFPDVKFYYLEENRGFGAGNNFLAEQGSSAYILILNPDTKFIEPRTISRLLEWMNKGKDVVGPRLLTSENTTQYWDHGEAVGWRGCLWKLFLLSTWHEQKKALEAAWVSGACMLIKRTAFEEVGGFDERFFLYHEELDMCFRLGRLKRTIWYDPRTVVFHKGSVVASKEKHMSASDHYLAKKYNHPWQKLVRSIITLCRR